MNKKQLRVYRNSLIVTIIFGVIFMGIHHDTIVISISQTQSLVISGILATTGVVIGIAMTLITAWYPDLKLDPRLGGFIAGVGVIMMLNESFFSLLQKV